MKLKFTIVAVLCLIVAGFLLSQDPGQVQPGLQPGADVGPQGDPPSRVARLNYMDGAVSYRPDAVQDWAPATLNFPLTNGDHLWTDQQSHVELHIGSKALRMADQTALSVLNLDDNTAQLSLSQGALRVAIRSLEPGESFEVDTPNGAVTFLRPGNYRLDVNPEANFTAVTVNSGDAEVTGGGQAFPVHARQQGHFSGSDQLAFDVVPTGASDPWDQWCSSREQKEQRAAQAAAAYVPQEMVGAEDLGGYGTWRQNPEYGAVWVPSGVQAGWEPYRYGHWAFVRPWGWTWIDDAPWGFAPFHYGRWVVLDGTWVWVPGRREGRPVYAPALVAFVGGPRFGASIGFGGGGVAAWVVLGPGEVFRPEYRHSERYIREVNIVHVRDVTVINRVNVTEVTYVNRAHVVAVPQAAFVGARPIGAAAVRVSPDAISRAQVVHGNAFAPSRESFAGRPMPAGGGAGVRVAAPPPAVVNRPVIVRNAVPPTAGGSRPNIPTRSANPGGGTFTSGTPRSGGAPGGAPAGAGPGAGSGSGRPGMNNAPSGSAPGNPNIRPGGAPGGNNNAPGGGAGTNPNRPGMNQPREPTQQQPQRQPQVAPAPQSQPQQQQPVPQERPQRQQPAPPERPQHQPQPAPQAQPQPQHQQPPQTQPQQKKDEKRDEKKKDEKEKKPPQQ